MNAVLWHPRSGPTGQRIPLEGKVGDTILFRRDSGSEGTGTDEELLILREEDGLGILP